MAYAQDDYEVLKEARKLSYFDYSFKDETKTASVSPVCHFCLKEVVLKYNDGKETSVVIQAKGDKTFNCTFYENDKSQ